jgi:hypothetical protein
VIQVNDLKEKTPAIGGRLSFPEPRSRGQIRFAQENGSGPLSSGFDALRKNALMY